MHNSDRKLNISQSPKIDIFFTHRSEDSEQNLSLFKSVHRDS